MADHGTDRRAGVHPAARAIRMARPKAIVFDLWGTLIESDDFTPSRGNARLLETAASDAPLAALQAFEDGLVADAERREDACGLEFTRQSLQRLLNDRFAIRSPLSLAEQEWEFWSSSMTIGLIDGVREMLDDLVRRSIRRAIVSNSSFTADVISRSLADLGVGDRFEHVVSSADYGVRKPHPAIFAAALDRLGLTPGEAWFAGDNPAYDLAGGVGAGMFTVLFRQPAPTPLDLAGASDGYARIERWSELAGLLDACPA